MQVDLDEIKGLAARAVLPLEPFRYRDPQHALDADGTANVLREIVVKLTKYADELQPGPA